MISRRKAAGYGRNQTPKNWRTKGTQFWKLQKEQNSKAGTALDKLLFRIWYLCWNLTTEDPERQLSEFRDAADPARVAACLVFDKAEKSTSERTYTLARRILDGLIVVAGTNANFTELNRQQPPREVPMVYSFNPQVHAFDDLSVMETLEAQVPIVESARRFCEGPIHVSPITLRPRFDPNASESEDDAGRENALPAAVDPRQRELITAAWTVGTLANLLGREQLVTLTFFQTWVGRALSPGPSRCQSPFVRNRERFIRSITLFAR
jgi:hypothetical protein